MPFFDRPLIRQLGLIYVFDGFESSDDPNDCCFGPEESIARKMTIIEQHPDTGIADVYRAELVSVNHIGAQQN